MKTNPTVKPASRVAHVVAFRTVLPHESNRVATLPEPNPGVIHRLIVRHGFTPNEANEGWRDLMRFLALAATCGETVAPTKCVDTVWHEALLDTRYYQQLCRVQFGKFIHHVPSGPNEHSDGSVLARTRQLLRREHGPLGPNWETPNHSHSPEGCVSEANPRRSSAPVSAGACASDCEPRTEDLINPSNQ